MHSKSTHPAIVLKVNLGGVRALKNVERTYLLDSIIRVENLSKGAELELYRDFLKHHYLVISGVL